MWLYLWDTFQQSGMTLLVFIYRVLPKVCEESLNNFCFLFLSLILLKAQEVKGFYLILGLWVGYLKLYVVNITKTIKDSGNELKLLQFFFKSRLDFLTS